MKERMEVDGEERERERKEKKVETEVRSSTPVAPRFGANDIREKEVKKLSKAQWDKKEKAQALIIAEQKRELPRMEGELEEQRKEQEKVKSRVKDKTKITSKKSAKAGATESDSSNTPSLNKMYRASGKNPISTPGHVSSSKSSRKEGSPAKKVKMDNFHSDHAGPSQVTSGQRHLTKTEALANKGSNPPPSSLPKSPQGREPNR